MKITIPLYLGESKEENGYFFLALDNGRARFIKYSSTRKIPFWCYSVSLPDFLDLGEVPESVLNEVINFVGGPVEIITRVVPQGSSKKKSAVIPISQEVHGELNVTSDIQKQESKRSNSSIKVSFNSDDDTGESSYPKLPIQERQNQEDGTTTTTESSGSNCEERIGGRFKTNPSTRHLRIRGLPSPGGDGIGLLDEECESEPRRMFGTGVLDTGRIGERSLHDESTATAENHGGLHGTHDGVKPKRKRRTKVEMEESKCLKLKT